MTERERKKREYRAYREVAVRHAANINPTGVVRAEPGHPFTNRVRLMREFYDLRAVLGMIGIDAWDTSELARQCESDKVTKVERFLQYSRMRGTLTDG